MLKNFLKKKSSDETQNAGSEKMTDGAMADALSSMPGAPDESQMNFVQKMAWKQFQKMSPEKQRQVMKKAMTPENIEKNKDMIVKQLEDMKAAGMMSDDQYRLAKRKLGLK